MPTAWLRRLDVWSTIFGTLICFGIFFADHNATSIAETCFMVAGAWLFLGWALITEDQVGSSTPRDVGICVGFLLIGSVTYALCGFLDGKRVPVIAPIITVTNPERSLKEAARSDQNTVTRLGKNSRPAMNMTTPTAAKSPVLNEPQQVALSAGGRREDSEAEFERKTLGDAVRAIAETETFLRRSDSRGNSANGPGGPIHEVEHKAQMSLDDPDLSAERKDVIRAKRHTQVSRLEDLFRKGRCNSGDKTTRRSFCEVSEPWQHSRHQDLLTI